MSRWPYSDKRWPPTRRAQLSASPFCRYCEQVGELTPATVADHIKMVRDYPELAFDPDNIQSLCASCHSQVKQSEERQGRPKGCDDTGEPIGGWLA